MLTDESIVAAQPRERGYKLADELGLFVFVTPAGAKSLRFKYRFQGREQLLTFGPHPRVSLAEARRRRDAARSALRAKMDPRDIIERMTDRPLDRLNHVPASDRAIPDRIYFIRATVSGFIKIGVAINVQQRLTQIQATVPETVELIGSLRGSYPGEVILHRLFAEDRSHGEWFRPSSRLLEFIADNIDRDDG